jgi:uncharacterized membrane protein (UPF0127 family)
MKKIKITILFAFFIAIYLFVFNNNHCKNNQAKKYQINNKNYCLLTANNQKEWERGLMFYKKPVNFDGMIFIFPEKSIRSFWNENTYMDLDIYWMDENIIIGKSFLPSIEKNKKIITVKSKEGVNKVVEIIK